MSGQIRELLDRVAAIETHVGINPTNKLTDLPATDSQL
jgi:hypothetical protein